MLVPGNFMSGSSWLLASFLFDELIAAQMPVDHRLRMSAMEPAERGSLRRLPRHNRDWRRSIADAQSLHHPNLIAQGAYELVVHGVNGERAL
jgi:hypothetical protein